MEFADLVRRRRMVRRYQPDRAVPTEIRDRLVDVARRVPSAGHSQGVSFLVLDDPGDRDRYWAATAPDGPADRWLSGMRTAPLLILIWTSEDAYHQRYAEPDKGWGPREPERWSAPYWYVDAGMAALAMLYAVVDADAGLGGCFFGVPAERIGAVREAFGVPEEQASVGVISVGYRLVAAGAARSPRRPRRPAAETVHHGSW